MGTRDLMLGISRKMRERTLLDPGHSEYLNPTSFSDYFKPLKKLLDMNDVMIPWQRVYYTFPPEENASAAATLPQWLHPAYTLLNDAPESGNLGVPHVSHRLVLPNVL